MIPIDAEKLQLYTRELDVLSLRRTRLKKTAVEQGQISQAITNSFMGRIESAMAVGLNGIEPVVTHQTQKEFPSWPAGLCTALDIFDMNVHLLGASTAAASAPITATWDGFSAMRRKGRMYFQRATSYLQR